MVRVASWSRFTLTLLARRSIPSNAPLENTSRTIRPWYSTIASVSYGITTSSITRLGN